MEITTPTPFERRRLNFLRTLLTYVPIFGIASAIGYATIYFIYHNWQFLAVAVVSLVCTLIWGIAVFLFRRGQINATIVILTFSTLAIFPAFALFWSGTGVQLILILGSWIIPMILVFYGSQPDNRRYLIVIGCIASTAAILLIDAFQPVSRVNVTELALLRWLIPLISIMGGSLLLMLFTQTSLAGRLYTRTLASFFLVVIIPMITISTITTINRFETDRQTAIDSLDSNTTQKSDAINLWAANIQNDVSSITYDAATIQNIQTLLQAGSANLLTGAERGVLVDWFNNILSRSERLAEIFIIDPGGNVAFSTLPTRLLKNYYDTEFFLEGLAGPYITQPFYLQDTGEMAVIVTRPILNNQGQTIGVLAGRANMEAINQIVSSRIGLGETGSSLLVSSNHDLLNDVITGLPTEQVNTDAVVSAFSTEGVGSLFYNNQDNIPVLGVYQWIPDLQVAVITEMNQSEIYEDAQSVLRTNILITLLAVGLAALGAIITTRTISIPVRSLANMADQVASGNLSARAEITQEDELGTLGQTMNNMTAQIQELVTNLEQRVSDRTNDLERRTTEIRTAAQVARDASVARNVDELLNRSAQLIRERFGFYHVGIFLIDGKGEYAVLSAAGGEAGQLMLVNQHKLRVGEAGIVGYVADTGQPRVALDTGKDSVFFRNPLLPYTHSEIALPLKVGARIIGVLDVQSDKVNAFAQEDIEILQVMADQIAVAIERTRLLQESEQAIQRMEVTSREYTGQAWREFTQHTREHQGYRYQGTKIEPITTPPPGSEDVMINGTRIFQKEPKTKTSLLAVPIKLRGLTLGTLNMRFQGDIVPAQTITVVEEAADRLALALENARLFEETTSRAEREQMVSEITSKIRSTTDPKNMLETAVEQLGKILGSEDIQIKPFSHSQQQRSDPNVDNKPNEPSVNKAHEK